MRIALLLALAAPLLGLLAAAAPGEPSAATATPAPAAAPADDPDAGTELLGRPAPGWSFERWVREPQSLAELRGRVVLLRWWTEGCRFCETTLPAIERLRREHAGAGLVVIGAFHPKPPRPVSDVHVLRVARRLGFDGPIALDRRWTTLERYWLAADPRRNWTSVSFLLDRQGRIRWVHGGGEYHPSDDPGHARCARRMEELERVLAAVLAEGTPDTP